MATPRAVAPPSKVWISSYEFFLHFVLPDDEDLDGSDGVTYLAEDRRGIFIAAHLDDRKMLEIVWHEITHAVNWTCDIDEAKRAIKEETLARKHGLAWSQFFLDNPKFVRWYTHVVNRIRKERKDA